MLADLLANRAWLRRPDPFPHVVADDVFSPAFYDELCGQLGGILDHGLSDIPSGPRFSRGMPGYDAYGISITPETGGPLALFVSSAWRDLMCGLFGVGRTPYVFAGAHHHAAGGADGFVHSDFNPVWFPRADGDSIQVPDQSRCDFKSGAGSLEAKVETIRGVVVIFYLLNDHWRPGDGGETGLFRSAHDPLPAARCPPTSNSLVAFECTPRSFHAYLGNPGRPRTSIIMWIHRERDEAVEKYGEEHIERWK